MDAVLGARGEPHLQIRWPAGLQKPRHQCKVGAPVAVLGPRDRYVRPQASTTAQSWRSLWIPAAFTPNTAAATRRTESHTPAVSGCVWLDQPLVR